MDSDSIDQFTCIGLQVFTITITLLGFIAHLGLGVFYYCTTGTFPVKETIIARIEELKETRAERVASRQRTLSGGGDTTANEED